MAKFILTHGTRFGGEHHDKGETIDLNPDKTEDARLIGELGLANRIALASPEVVKQIQAELRKEETDKAAAAAAAAKAR